MQIYLARNSQQAGPYSLEQINQMLQDQQILLTDLAWHQGMSEWKALGELTRGQSQYQPEGDQYSYTPPTQKQQSTQNTASELASISSRFLAKVIDLLIWLPAFTLPSFFLNADSSKKIEAIGNSFSKAAQNQIMQLIPNQAWFAMLIYIVIMLIIQAFLLNKYEQSIGKMITKIKIVDQINESKVSLTRIFLIRSVFFIILNILFMPAILIIDHVFAFGKKHQTLHDRLSKTKVIISNKK